jgi:hypothetical protein
MELLQLMRPDRRGKSDVYPVPGLPAWAVFTGFFAYTRKSVGKIGLSNSSRKFATLGMVRIHE